MLREVDHRVGLTAAMNGCIAAPRDPMRIVHDQETLLRQRVFGIALGYEDLNDHTTLRTDPMLHLPPPSSTPDDSPKTELSAVGVRGPSALTLRD